MKQRKIERVMLVNLPVRQSTFFQSMLVQPMGLSYLAAVLRDKYDVKVLDAPLMGFNQIRKLDWNYIEYGLSQEDIMKEVAKFDPQVVGLSCLFSHQMPLVAQVSSGIKQMSPDIITVAGGTHPSFLPEKSFELATGLDFIVLSESERSLVQLLAAIEKGNPFAEIDGLAWKENGEVKVNPKTKFIENLDGLPFPARDLLDLETYFKVNLPFFYYSKNNRNVSFITSRGCPFKCTFCSSCNYWGNHIRYRSVDNVLQEMREIKSRFNVQELKFEDDNLLLDKKRAKQIFRAMIDEKFNFTWNMPNGAYVASMVDEELVRLMKESGCFEVILAIESGNQDVLDNIVHKPLELPKVERAIKNLKDNDIDIHAFLIVGFPGETKEQIKDTFLYARKIGLDHAYVFIYNPLPGSALFDECIQKGYYTHEMVMRAGYSHTGCTTSEFNPEMLMKWQQSFSIFQNLEMLYKNPKKLFTKYMGRTFSRQNYRALTMALRTFLVGLIKN